MDETDRIALVFNRNKATGNAGESKARQQNAGRQSHHHYWTGLQHCIQDRRITLLETAVEAVEVGEDHWDEVADSQADRGEKKNWKWIEEEHSGDHQAHHRSTDCQGKPQGHAGDLGSDEANQTTRNRWNDDGCGAIASTQ